MNILGVLISVLVTLYILIAIAFENAVGKMVYGRGIPDNISVATAKTLVFIVSIFWPLFFIFTACFGVYQILIKARKIYKEKQAEKGGNVPPVFEEVPEPDTMEDLIDNLVNKPNEK